MTNYFHVFPTKLSFIIYGKHTLFLLLSHSHKDTYAQTHGNIHMHRNSSVLPCNFINKIVLQLKSYNIFSSELVTLLFLKQRFTIIRDAAAAHC